MAQFIIGPTAMDLQMALIVPGRLAGLAVICVSLQLAGRYGGERETAVLMSPSERTVLEKLLAGAVASILVAFLDAGCYNGAKLNLQLLFGVALGEFTAGGENCHIQKRSRRRWLMHTASLQP
ncbi:hypothetical protein XENORESO_011980, partial [Xenotaenia resolanae]